MQVHVPFPSPARRWLVLLPILGCLSCSGSGGLNPVHGKVFYKNRPMGGALVTFHPKGANDFRTLRPTGFVQEDGTFGLTTGQQEGAVAGDYIVTVIWPEVAPAKKGIMPPPPDTQDRLRGAYAKQATSTLQVQIKKGNNTLEPFALR